MTRTDIPVLLTRPEPDATRFARRLAGCRVVISPVLDIVVQRPATDPRAFDRLVFTSANGIRAAVALYDLSGMAGYAVGERTAEVGRAHGLDLVPCGETGTDLVARIIRDRPAGRLLHLRGQHSRGDVARSLNEAGLETVSAICYDQLELPLSDQALALLARPEPVILPLFSPRTARIVGAQAASARAQLVLVGLSPAVLDAWAGPPPLSRLIAEAPTADAMVRKIQAFLSGSA